jgi:6-phosphofructokinase
MAKRLGILTGGGDAPGLNALIRAAVTTAAASGWATIGIEDSFEGLKTPRWRPLTVRDVAGIHRLGGTILGTVSVERLAGAILAKARAGARWSVIVAAEGAYPIGGPPRERETGRETRVTVLGHLHDDLRSD